MLIDHPQTKDLEWSVRTTVDLVVTQMLSSLPFPHYVLSTQTRPTLANGVRSIITPSISLLTLTVNSLHKFDFPLKLQSHNTHFHIDVNCADRKYHLNVLRFFRLTGNLSKMI